jgi:hypothetical protein
MSGSVPSFCSSAFLVRPPDEMGTRRHYQRAPWIEFTTRCWQPYLAKAGPCCGMTLLQSTGLTQCRRRGGSWEKSAAGYRWQAAPWNRTHARRAGVRVGRTKPANPSRQPGEAGVSRSPRRRPEFTAIRACCSCSVDGIAMHAGRPSQSGPTNDGNRSR